MPRHRAGQLFERLDGQTRRQVAAGLGQCAHVIRERDVDEDRLQPGIAARDPPNLLRRTGVRRKQHRRSAVVNQIADRGHWMIDRDLR